MEIRSYNSFSIKPIISNRGVFYTLSISKIWIAEGQQDSEEEIVKFGQTFYELNDVENFQKTKLYKSILKTVEKYHSK